MTRKRLLILILWFTCLTLRAMAAEVFVAAAADLNFAMKEMIGPFERQTGHRVKLSFGSSGNFYSQIVNGAPYDMFFSADVSYPRKLEAAGMAESETLFVYAMGRIVIWVPINSPIDLDRSGMQALSDPSIRKIAIANPAHAPYGRAAVAAMEHFKIYEKLQDKLVSGESVLQAAQFVQSGAADIGIIPLSLALAPVMRQSGRYWRIPSDTYPKIEQGALILKRARQSGDLAAAQAFRDWVRSRQGRDVLARFGFALPEEGTR
jgi:molybdate transport system substrate-binding protein